MRLTYDFPLREILFSRSIWTRKQSLDSRKSADNRPCEDRYVIFRDTVRRVAPSAIVSCCIPGISLAWIARDTSRTIGRTAPYSRRSHRICKCTRSRPSRRVCTTSMWVQYFARSQTHSMVTTTCLHTWTWSCIRSDWTSRPGRATDSDRM